MRDKGIAKTYTAAGWLSSQAYTDNGRLSIIMAAHVQLICLLALLRPHLTEPVESSKLLLFLLDGFRWDYMDTLGLDLPGFKRIISQGVQAEYMIPDFPTLSYPNYYSIMTGLHCEGHGMVGNYMYDVKHKEYFLIGTNEEQYHSYWWDDGEPLWVTAEKQNKHAFMYFWPGCEVTIRGVKPTYCEKYAGIPTISDLQTSIDQGLALLGNGSADVVGIYVESPDAQGHKYGTSSTQLKDAITDIDKEMTKLMDRLKTDGLEDVVNIMIFSDHGMTEVSESRVVNISMVVDMDDIKATTEKGPNAYIWPKEGKVDKVYDDLIGANLQHVTVYRKSQIPDRWFYKTHYRISPILLVADEGWYIVTPKYQDFAVYPDGPMQGHHGYDNADVNMRSIFYAVGPDISVGKTIKSFANVHLYQVMCKILGIQPSQNDGDWEEVKGLLRTDVTSGSSQSTSISCLLLTLTIVCGVFMKIGKRA